MLKALAPVTNPLAKVMLRNTKIHDHSNSGIFAAGSNYWLDAGNASTPGGNTFTANASPSVDISGPGTTSTFRTTSFNGVTPSASLCAGPATCNDVHVASGLNASFY